MDAAQIADLLTQGIRGPVGPEDSAFHTGTVLSWDEISQANSVYVNGTTLNNVRAIQSGIGVLYQAGDVVVLIRKQTQYFVLGKVSAPGGNNANQIKSQSIQVQEGTGSTTYTDLATFGPQVTATIGSSRRCLVMFGCWITSVGTASNTYIGGDMRCAVTGASSFNIIPCSSYWLAQTTLGWGGGANVFKSVVLTAADGLNAGSNTFTLKYKSTVASPTCAFADRAVTVIPF